MCDKDWQAGSPELRTFALDEGPAHPVFPGVGFLTMPELSWRHLDGAQDVVRVGQRVTCGGRR